MKRRLSAVVVAIAMVGTLFVARAPAVVAGQRVGSGTDWIAASTR
jgi:hypothetical protein